MSSPVMWEDAHESRSIGYKIGEAILTSGEWQKWRWGSSWVSEELLVLNIIKN